MKLSHIPKRAICSNKKVCHKNIIILISCAVQIPIVFDQNNFFSIVSDGILNITPLMICI